MALCRRKKAALLCLRVKKQGTFEKCSVLFWHPETRKSYECQTVMRMDLLANQQQDKSDECTILRLKCQLKLRGNFEVHPKGISPSSISDVHLNLMPTAFVEENGNKYSFAIFMPSVIFLGGAESHCKIQVKIFNEKSSKIRRCRPPYFCGSI